MSRGRPPRSPSAPASSPVARRACSVPSATAPSILKVFFSGIKVFQKRVSLGAPLDRGSSDRDLNRHQTTLRHAQQRGAPRLLRAPRPLPPVCCAGAGGRLDVRRRLGTSAAPRSRGQAAPRQRRPAGGLLTRQTHAGVCSCRAGQQGSARVLDAGDRPALASRRDRAAAGRQASSTGAGRAASALHRRVPMLGGAERRGGGGGCVCGAAGSSCAGRRGSAPMQERYALSGGLRRAFDAAAQGAARVRTWHWRTHRAAASREQGLGAYGPQGGSHLSARNFLVLFPDNTRPGAALNAVLADHVRRVTGDGEGAGCGSRVD